MKYFQAPVVLRASLPDHPNASDGSCFHSPKFYTQDLQQAFAMAVADVTWT